MGTLRIFLSCCTSDANAHQILCYAYIKGFNLQVTTSSIWVKPDISDISIIGYKKDYEILWKACPLD